MRRAGFVLVGGCSSRMGRNKALMPYRDSSLLERVAGEVASAAGSVTLVGPPEEYRDLGLPVIPDRRPGSGPLGGVEAALEASEAEWNLIVACDMPNLSAPLLGSLLDRADAEDTDCLAALSGPGRIEPLCAVWSRRCLRHVSNALDTGKRKMTDALDGLRVAAWQPGDEGWAVNLNSPEDL
ncbi:MAG: molybdenum cofactor guanylyltransferase, partial [bacterium]|nr:molybdenum cofactor guanylyltransferase [bacterium]